MSLIKTWSFNINVTPTDQTTITQQARSFWVQLKEFLVNVAGWTVVQSSDSITTSASDLWGTTLSKLVIGTSSVARSWILLKSPEGIVAGADGSYLGNQSRTYLCIELQSGSANYAQCTITYHRELPIGGSITAVPTSPTSQSTTSGSAFLGSTLISGSKFHFGAVTTGEGTPAKGKGAFYAMISNPTIVGITTFLSVIPVTATLTGGITGDYAYATGLKLSYNAAQTSIFLTTLFDSIKGWNHDGSVTSTLYGLYYNGTPGGVGINTTSTGDTANKNPASDILLYNSGIGFSGAIGKIADFEYTAATGLLNCISGESGTLYHCFLQPNVWVPTTTNIIP